MEKTKVKHQTNMLLRVKERIKHGNNKNKTNIIVILQGISAHKKDYCY